MNFRPLASSSLGNAYLLTSSGITPLLLEAGIPVKKLREKGGFSISELAGCLISHEHGDHSRAVNDLLKAGVDCWMSAGTARVLGVRDHHRTNIVSGGQPFKIEEWKIHPFLLEHDAVEPLGFFIEDAEGSTCLFIPDTGFVRNRFLSITMLCIECNFVPEILTNNIVSGHLPQVVGHRVRRNHMSLDTVIAMIKANDLTECREIWLLHLSDGNSDEKRMRAKVQEATGIPTFIAAA